MNLKGEYIARETALYQTLEGFMAFGLRLDAMHDLMLEQGECTCTM